MLITCEEKQEKTDKNLSLLFQVINRKCDIDLQCQAIETDVKTHIYLFELFQNKNFSEDTELFLVRIFLYLEWIRRETEYLSVFSPNTGKYGPEITLYLDNFYAVLLYGNLFLQFDGK